MRLTNSCSSCCSAAPRRRRHPNRPQTIAARYASLVGRCAPLRECKTDHFKAVPSVCRLMSGVVSRPTAVWSVKLNSSIWRLDAVSPGRADFFAASAIPRPNDREEPNVLCVNPARSGMTQTKAVRTNSITASGATSRCSVSSRLS